MHDGHQHITGSLKLSGRAVLLHRHRFPLPLSVSSKKRPFPNTQSKLSILNYLFEYDGGVACQKEATEKQQNDSATGPLACQTVFPSKKAAKKCGAVE